MQYQRGKKRGNSLNWLCFTARRSEDSSTQRLHHVIVSRQFLHSMTSYPQQIAVPFAVCIFGGFGEMPWRPSPPKIQGCRIDQQIQRWLKDQLQEQFNVQIERLMFCKAIRHYLCLHCTILHYAEPFHATLHHLCVRCTIRHYAEPFHATLHCLCVRCTFLHYAQSFHATLHHLCVRCTIRHYAEPFHATLHCLYVRCTILHYAELFHATLHRLCVHCATRHYPVPFHATLHRLCTVLQMSAKLFAIELVHFTISCFNSTWATGPFIIWLDCSCLGCSVS